MNNSNWYTITFGEKGSIAIKGEYNALKQIKELINKNKNNIRAFTQECELFIVKETNGNICFL